MACFFSIEDDFESIIRTHLKNVRKIEKISTGWTNFVFKAETGKGNFIFRFPRNVFFAEAMKKEVVTTHWVRQVFPQLTVNIHKGEDKDRIFSIHKMKKGKPILEVYPHLNNHEKSLFAKDLTRYLSKLWAKTPFFEQKFKKEEQNKNETLSQFLLRLSLVNDDENYNVVPILFLQTLEKQTFVHGDLNPGNIIVNNKGRIKAVLDYAFFTSSTHFADVARMIGRMPSEFEPLFKKEMEKKTGKFPDYLPLLVDMWQMVEEDYVAYINRSCPDIVLPEKKF